MNDENIKMTETEYLLSLPKMEEIIIEGLNTPLEECADESEVEW